jgi:hypothetical protein
VFYRCGDFVMLEDEKVKLLELLHAERRWCKEAEARDRRGRAVRYDDTTAVAWDLTGAVCLLFGWRRAGELFRQLDRHITGQKRKHRLLRDPTIASMAALQDFNDLRHTTYDEVMTLLRTMSVRPRKGL